MCVYVWMCVCVCVWPVAESVKWKETSSAYQQLARVTWGIHLNGCHNQEK